jgi:hypothetical protein
VVITNVLPMEVFDFFIESTPNINTAGTPWVVGTVAPNSSGVVTVSVNLDSGIMGEMITNTVQIDSSTPDGVANNNEASAVVTISDVAYCTIEQGDSLVFANSASQPITITVDTVGTLGCLYVTPTASTHPTATANFIAGYWTITGAQEPGGGTPAGFSVSMTAPQPNLINPRLCKNPGNLGGQDWDCDTGVNTTSTTSTVTRMNITSFSDWAVAADVGPTAVQLQGVGVENAKTTSTIVWLFGLMVLLTGFVGWQREVLKSDSV